MIEDDPRDHLARLQAISEDRVIGIVNRALAAQRIVSPQFRNPPTAFAGGTNMVPNSDLAWSEMAATTAGITPATAGATNLEVYRVTRQKVGDPISSQRLRTVEADPWIPLWDRVQGVGELGGASGHDNYDIAFQLTNNWLVGNRKWYVRVAVATKDDTPLPEGSKLFAGFWVKRTGSEGWATGGTFSITHKIFGVHGSRSFDYKVIAKTDSGFSLESSVLTVTDIPDTLDADNYVQITYPGAAGYTEFEVYRKDNATGEVRQIARDRNSSKLVAYDNGQEGRLETGGFPSVDTSLFRAYAEVEIDAVSIDVKKTFHNMTIVVPSNFDTSTLVAEGTYLRIGVKDSTAVDLQVLVDTVWASETYNVWSPSPFDDYPSPPSTSMVTAPPASGGGGGDPPPAGGGRSCVWVEHDIKLEDGWERFGDTQKHRLVDGGTGTNELIDLQDGEDSQYLMLIFDSGLVIRSSYTQRYIRSFDDHSGILVTRLEVGDQIQGGDTRGPKLIRLLRKIPVPEPLQIRAATVGPVSKFYAVGDRRTGEVVYLHNEKALDDIFA